MDEPYEQENLDEAIELSLESVKKRAVRGVAILTFRGFLIQFITQISFFFLLAFMEPEQLGVFWIVSAAVGFLIYFSDIGLAAALIQKKEKVTDLELKTTFTVQQTLIIVLLAVLYFISPFIKAKYNLSTEGVYLLFALGASLFLSSLKSIPSVLLERKLDFVKFVIPEIIENFVYNLTLVTLAWKGYGIMSFTYAVLARGIVGVVTIYILQPWLPGIAFSKKALKRLLSFGVPYQANTLISVVKDQGITLILGGILGQAAIGYLGVAQRFSQLPLRQFMDNVMKVSFPAFARMQDDKKHLSKSYSQAVFFVSFLVFPSTVGLVLLAPDVLNIIPKYSKWTPALIPLAIMGINTLFASVATQSTNLLTAIGKISITIKLSILYSILTLTLIPFLATRYSVEGAAVGYATIGVVSSIAVYLANKYADLNIVKSIIKPLTAVIVMGVSIRLLQIVLVQTLFNLVITIVIASAVYGFVSLLLYGSELIKDGQKLVKSIANR